jgi:hypothetical protein
MGTKKGSVDRKNNIAGEPLIIPDVELRNARKALMEESPYLMEAAERAIVLTAIRQRASYRGWHLFAAHVRTNHVHIVVVGDATPERMMTEFKAYATRALNRISTDMRQKHWTRHGSTRWLNTEESLGRAIEYTVAEQGETMAVYDGRSNGVRMPENEPRPQGSA